MSELADGGGPTPEVGQVWKSKRESWRQVTITDVSDSYVNVRRNTSWRRQAISRATLVRTYVLVRAPWIES